MKISLTKADAGFQPVTLTLTFETQEQLDFWASLFNCVALHDAVRDINPYSDATRHLDDINDKLMRNGGNGAGVTAIVNVLKKALKN
jgi:hypothetical protein